MNSNLSKFKSYLIAVKGINTRTADMYCRVINAVLNKIDTISATSEDFFKYISDMRDTYSYRYIVNSSIAIEHYSEFIGTPVKLGRPKKPKREIGEVLTEAEIAVILAIGCKNIREKAMVSILAYSGIRNNELCNLKVSDIDIANNLINVREGKGAKDRKANIAGECCEIIMKYLQKFPRESEDYLFTTLRYDNQFQPASLRKTIRVIGKRSTIPKRIYPHIFRHSLAVNMLKRGASIFDIKFQLGHDDIMTTIQVYLRNYNPDSRANYLKFAPCYV